MIFGWLCFIFMLTIEIGNIICSKTSTSFNPFILFTYKYFIGAMISIPILIGMNMRNPKEKIFSHLTLKTIALVAVSWIPGGTMVNASLFLASKYTSISHISCILGLYPILAIVFKSGKVKLGFRDYLAIFLLIVSNIISLASGNSAGQIKGDLFALLSTVIMFSYQKFSHVYLTHVPSVLLAGLSMVFNFITSFAIVSTVYGAREITIAKLYDFEFGTNAIFLGLYGLASTVSFMLSCKYFKLHIISVCLQLTPTAAHLVWAFLGKESVSLESLTSASFVVLGLILLAKNDKEGHGKSEDNQSISADGKEKKQ